MEKKIFWTTTKTLVISFCHLLLVFLFFFFFFFPLIELSFPRHRDCDGGSLMAFSAILSLPPYPFLTRVRTTKLAVSSLRLPHQRHGFPLFPQLVLPVPSRATVASFAYVSGPASDPIIGEEDPNFEGSDSKAQLPSPSVVSWGLLWRLLMKHKLRLALSALTLIGCTTCTLSMPIFSGSNTACNFGIICHRFLVPVWLLRKLKRKRN